MDLPIVVGVDGSELSLRAVDWAADEAALRGVSLRLVYASLWERYEGALDAQELGKPIEEVMALDVVGTARDRAQCRHAGLDVTTDVLPKEPEVGLVDESGTALAVVLGCRGRNRMAEALLGSVSLAVAGHAYCPVIVLRGSQDNRASPGTRGRIVLGVGEKSTGSAAAQFAIEEAVLRGVPLDSVRAWRRAAHTATGNTLFVGEPAHFEKRQAVEVLEDVLRGAPADLEVNRRTVEGHARDVLIAASREADLLVVGARRRYVHAGLRLGPVARNVLHHAVCPVAVVPEPS